MANNEPIKFEKSKEQVEQEAQNIAAEKIKERQEGDYGTVRLATPSLVKKGVDILTKKPEEKKEFEFPKPEKPFPIPAPAGGSEDIFSMSAQQRKEYLKTKERMEKEQVVQEGLSIFELTDKGLREPNFDSIKNGGNVYPLFDESKQRTGDYVYYPFKGEEGYVFENATRLEAVKAAKGYYDTLRTSGANVVPQAYKNLNSLVRRSAYSGGDYNEVKKIMADEKRARFRRVLDELKKDPKYKDYTEEGLIDAAFLKAAGKEGLFGVPRYILNGLKFASAMGIGMGTRAAGGLDSFLDIVPGFDGLFTGAWTGYLNGAQKMEELFNKNTDYRDGNVLILDKNLNIDDIEDATVKPASSKYPFLSFKPSEFQKAIKQSVAPNPQIRAIRLLSEDLIFGLGVIGAVGKSSAKYYDDITNKAIDNIKKNNKSIKNITDRMIYNEAKLIRNAQFEQLRENNTDRISDRISKYLDNQLIDYNYNPLRYNLSFTASEGVLSLGMAYGEYYAQKLHKGYSFRPGEFGEGAGFYEVLGGVAGGMVSMLAASSATKLINDVGVRYATKGGLALTNLASNIVSIDPTKTVPQLLSYLKMNPDDLEAMLRGTNKLLNSDAIKEQPKLEETARAFLKKHIEFRKKDPLGAAIYIKALERNQALIQESQKLGLLSADEVYVTLGAMAENDVVKAAEYTVDQMKTGSIKVDKKFNYLVDQAAILQKKQSMQLIIDRALSRLDSANLESASELFKFREALKKHSVKIAGDTAEFESIVRNTLVYDAFKMYDGTNLATGTVSKMDELLKEHPALRKLLPTSLFKKQNGEILDKVSELSSLNGKTEAARLAMNKDLIKIIGLHKQDEIKYDAKNILSMNNVSQAGRIQEYTSTVGLTILERLDDHYKYKYTDKYQRAYEKLEQIDPEIESINISVAKEGEKSLLSKIVEEATNEVFTEDPGYMKKIERIIEPSISRTVNKNIKELTQFMNSNGGDYTASDTLQFLRETIREKRTAELGDLRKAGDEVNMYDILEFMQTTDKLTMQKGEFIFDSDIKIDIKNFQDLRKLTHDFERKYYSKQAFDTGASDPRYSTFRKISDLFDNSFESYLQYLEKYGQTQKVITQEGRPVIGKYTELASELRNVEKEYKFYYRDRQRKSLLYKEFLRFSQRVDEAYYPEDMKEAAEAAMKYEKGDIYRPADMINGQYPNSRVRNSNMLAGEFFGRILQRFKTPDEFLGELETFVGDPVIVNGRFTGEYRLPKVGTEKHKVLSHFMEAFNHYVTARQASALDKLSIKKGTELNRGYFIQKRKKFLNKDLDKLSVKGIQEHVKQTGAGELIKELEGEGEFLTLIKGIDEGIQARTNGNLNLRGAEMYKNVLTASKLSDEILYKLEETVTNITNTEKANQPKFDKIRAETSTMAKIVNNITEEGLSIYNAEEFYDYALKTYNPATKKSEFIEKLLEVSNKYYKGDEKAAKEAVADILAVGFRHKYTKVSAIQTSADPADKINQLNKRLASANSKAERKKVQQLIDIEMKIQTDIKKGLGFEKNREKFAPYFEKNYYVDGDLALNAMAENANFISKYIGKNNSVRHRKLSTIFSLSRLSQQNGKEVAQALNFVDPTHGNTKFAFNTAMSRIAAVYSGRASIRYPMAEMSFALMQKNEAEAVAALLRADDKLIDLVYDVMMTGQVDPKLYDNKVVESFFVDQLNLSKNVIRGWIDSSDEITEQGWEKDHLLGLPPEATGEEEIFPIQEDLSGMAGMVGEAGLNENKRKRDKKTFRKLIVENLNRIMSEDDKKRYYGALDQSVNELTGKPKEVIESQMKDLLRREKYEREKRQYVR